MTYQNDFTLPAAFLEQIAEQGWEYLPELIQTMIDAAMQVERQKYLNASRYERRPERTGQANGYKPKTVKTRLGAITFAVPQVREGGFYPEALEKGLRSERALTLTLAEMYVQGVSTRKVAAVVEQLCGCKVSSSQVSRATSLLAGRPHRFLVSFCAPASDPHYQWCGAAQPRDQTAHPGGGYLPQRSGLPAPGQCHADGNQR
jgi:hypothetical protein